MRETLWGLPALLWYIRPMDMTLASVDYRIAGDAWLRSINLTLSSGQVWAVTGPNGSGKSALGRLLAGKAEPSSGSLTGRPGAVGHISFEEHLATIERELREDDTDYMDRIDPGRSALGFIMEQVKDEAKARLLGESFGLAPLFDRGLRFLSTGEIRKSLICRALMADPSLLVLDDPFCGLDKGAAASLGERIHSLSRAGITPVLILGRAGDVMPWVTHVAEMDQGRLVSCGPKAAWAKARHVEKTPCPAELPQACFLPGAETPEFSTGDPLVRFCDVSVAYNGRPVVDGVSFALRKGEHLMITGPNGSGKSTLLSMINGDNPKAYGNDISLFGRRRGTGESIWDIKKQIGYLSAEFQIGYRAAATPFSAILSGLSDSIGTYRRFSLLEKEAACAWLEVMGLSHRKESPLRSLSSGEQRMVLIARSMIKAPPLLILDEPCQGLDDANSRFVLDLADRVGMSGKTTLIYVTHTETDTLSCITHHLRLSPNRETGSTAWVERASGGPAGGQTFKKFDKQVLSKPFQAPPK
ncbi:ATP-binding cassette domain-containing protein [Desulfoluna spongiiphila]|uniref:Molybdate transport system ATP-binding protein n=2 Tax=Desulfoluna spongiiphila TaxID=419481 RepID=A0A1G5J474_9BACT|nr:ATP-binding cassette domain-containing protein [Desulfoluna spongiiphila]SCY83156.1 molybdate transport system ATP-binding protein [Desulfoluna spongiiphila]